MKQLIRTHTSDIRREYYLLFSLTHGRLIAYVEDSIKTPPNYYTGVMGGTSGWRTHYLHHPLFHQLLVAPKHLWPFLFLHVANTPALRASL